MSIVEMASGVSQMPEIFYDTVLYYQTSVSTPWKFQESTVTTWCLVFKVNLNMKSAETERSILMIRVFGYYHPAGDVTIVFVVPGKLTVKIGDVKNWWRGCRDKNLLKNAKHSFSSISRNL